MIVVGMMLKVYTWCYVCICVQLLGTQNRVIAEASPRDDIWGIGLHEQDEQARDIAHWRGQNLLGQVSLSHCLLKSTTIFPQALNRLRLQGLLSEVKRSPIGAFFLYTCAGANGGAIARAE